MGKNRLRDYFFTKTSAGRDEAIEKHLWNDAVKSDQFQDSAFGQYSLVLLEQYKIYVEMADRVSARRSAANTFFLTLNTAIFALIGVFWEHRPEGPVLVLVFPLVALVAQCMTWFWLLRSYRQLNSGKFAVVGALERR